MKTENSAEIIRKVHRVMNLPRSFSENVRNKIIMLDDFSAPPCVLQLRKDLGVHGVYREGSIVGGPIVGLRLIKEVQTYHPAGSGIGGGGPWATARNIGGHYIAVNWLRSSLHQIFCQIPEDLLEGDIYVQHNDYILGSLQFWRFAEFSCVQTSMKIFRLK